MYTQNTIPHEEYNMLLETFEGERESPAWKRSQVNTENWRESLDLKNMGGIF